MKITFKRRKKETGLGGVGRPYPPVDIKLDKKEIGYIVPKSWNNHYFKVRFMVNEGDKWKWITLKKECDTEEEARELAKAYVEKYPDTDFHFMED